MYFRPLCLLSSVLLLSTTQTPVFLLLLLLLFYSSSCSNSPHQPTNCFAELPLLTHSRNASSLFPSSPPPHRLHTTHTIKKNTHHTRSRTHTSTRRFSESDDDMATSIFTTPRGSVGGVSLSTLSSRASMQHDHVPHCSSKVGVVITSYRQSQRR